ncbi:MAG: N-acetyl-gamma-glutamyl-phosphate reductase [Saprospiraceae bacterium]
MKIKTGIIGGAGYAAGELLRLLLQHPAAEVAFATSNSQAGKPVWEVHDDLTGETDLTFSAGHHFDVDVLFLCGGHGASKVFLEKNSVPAGLKIIDLSADYRLDDSFSYGLPEVFKNNYEAKIANPGCFATAIQLALAPLAKAGLLKNEVHVNAITGSTGAGQMPSPTTHFSWRTANVSVYKPFSHQHLGEICETLTFLQKEKPAIHFIPMRGPFARGILATVYTKCSLEQAGLTRLFEEFYRNEPFTFVAAGEVHLKQVVNTNKCLLSVQKIGENVFVTSAIDNLLKGASGQAVQNMNLIFGLPEDAGLRLKAAFF